MLPEYHLALTFLLWYTLRTLGIQEPFLFFTMLIPGFFVDMDILVVRPHRRSPAHSIVSWIAVSLSVVPVNYHYALAIFISSLGHIASDMIDGAVCALCPFKKKLIGINAVAKKHNIDPGSISPVKFTKLLLHTPQVLVLEFFIDALAIGIFISSYNSLGGLLGVLLW